MAQQPFYLILPLILLLFGPPLYLSGPCPFLCLSVLIFFCLLSPFPCLSSNSASLFCQYVSFYRQLSLHGCFVFSGKGWRVYPVKIRLFITVADLGSAQAGSLRHQAAGSTDKLVEDTGALALYWSGAGSGTDSSDCHFWPVLLI